MPSTVRGSLSVRLRRLTDGTPLRVKLVAAVLVLVVLALAGSGVAARVTMEQYLVGRIDAQLTSAVNLIAGTDGRGAPAGDGRRDRLPSTYVFEVVDSAGATTGPVSNLVNPGQPLPRLPHPTGAQSIQAGTRTFTVDAMGGGGQWRVVAEPVTLPDGSAGTLLVAQSLGDVLGTVDRLSNLLLVIGAAAAVLIAGVGYFVVRASLRPLRVVEHTAAQIAAGDLSNRVPEAHPRTEVGHLSAALNTMLARIETAFAEQAASEHAARRSEERMRAFVADASHELRTPLTTIRGFAELYRHGAATDETDIAAMMSRIEGEATRMGLLVEDLLLLARMDQQRPLRQDPVDLLALAGDAVHDTQAVAPDRAVRLSVGVTDPPPVVIGDDARLRQVLGNLLANAVAHTPAGSPVTVTVGTTSGDHTGAPVAVLTVSDEGPGLSPEASGRVFERFYRADNARNRDDGGSGLGLAIVHALVVGHGGRVDVHSEPGQGASFRVVLPLADIAGSPG